MVDRLALRVDRPGSPEGPEYGIAQPDLIQHTANVNTSMSSGAAEVHVAMTVTLLLVLALAIRADQLEHRIPNNLTLTGLVLGLGCSTLADGVSGALAAAGGAITGGAVLLPFYLRRGMGAGDVKLMGASGAFLGPAPALVAAALALIAGAVLALGITAAQLIAPRLRGGEPRLIGGPESTTGSTGFLAVRETRFPYAIAIAVGVTAVLWQRGAIGALLATLGLQ